MGFEEDFAAALAALTGSGGTSTTSAPQVRPLQFSTPGYKRVGPATSSTSPMPGLYEAIQSAPVQPASKPWWASSLEKLQPLAEALQGVSGLVTNQIYNWTDGTADWKDIPLAESFANFGKGAVGAQNGFQAGDLWNILPPVALFNGLRNAGRESESTADIFENLGWKEGEADKDKGWNFLDRRKNNLDYSDIIEFAGDVLLDPLTYLTFGAGGAVKAGAGATIKEAGSQAAKYGIKVAADAAGDVARGTADDIAKIVAERAVAKGINPQLAARYGARQAEQALAAITNAGKGARATSQNALLSLDIPFTNISKPLIMKGANSGLRVADNVIGEVGSKVVTRTLNELGLSPEAQTQLLKSAYGVEKATDMTSQMLDHFNQTVAKLHKMPDLPNSKITQGVVERVEETVKYQPFDPETVLKGITDPAEQNLARHFANQVPTTSTTPKILGDVREMLGDLTPFQTSVPNALAGRADELLDFSTKAPAMVDEADVLRSIDELLQAGDNFRQAGHTAEVGPEVIREVVTKAEALPSSVPARNTQAAMKLFTDPINQFVQDMGGNSRFGRYISDRLFRSVNPRTLGSADDFVNEAAGKTRDAENMIRGNMTQMSRDLNRIKDLAKGLPEEDLAKIPYIIEGKFPGGKTVSEFFEGVDDWEQLTKVADEVKVLFERMKVREQGVGALGEGIKGYFPHVLKKGGLDPEALSQLMSDPKFQKYLGRNAANRFAKTRTSFDSFAEWDDAIAKLEEAAKTATPEEVAQIEEVMQRVSNLFERDPIVAVANRYRRHVRTTAMNQLYQDFRKTGVLKSASEIGKDGVTGAKGFTKVSGELSKKLGIKEGSYIHNEVLTGLERMDNLFTDKGMQTFLDNVTSITNIWKGLVTTPIPSHHVNNLIGNLANNAMAGVGLEDYRRAANLLKKLKRGKLSEAERRLVQEAYDKGVLASGNAVDVADPLRLSRIQGQGALAKAEDAVVNNPLSRGMRGVGDSIDDFSRMALYLMGKRTTGSAKHASTLVRQYLYNFGELTNADRAIKTVVPFWSWTKNNLPTQIMEFARQPRFYASYRHLQRMTDDQSNSAKPDWVADYLKIPGMDSYINPRLPMSDLSGLADPVRTGLNMLSPGIKVPFEVGLNKQVFNGAPIDPGKTSANDEYDPARLFGYLLKQTGAPGRVAGMFDPNTDLLNSILKMIGPMPVDVDQTRTIKAKIQEIKRSR